MIWSINFMNEQTSSSFYMMILWMLKLLDPLFWVFWSKEKQRIIIKFTIKVFYSSFILFCFLFFLFSFFTDEILCEEKHENNHLVNSEVEPSNLNLYSSGKQSYELLLLLSISLINTLKLCLF